jgi:hypothetical protein
MSSELTQHWTGEWKIQNKKSDWNNTSISLIQQNFNTLKQKKKRRCTDLEN